MHVDKANSIDSPRVMSASAEMLVETSEGSTAAKLDVAKPKSPTENKLSVKATLPKLTGTYSCSHLYHLRSNFNNPFHINLVETDR